MPTETIRFAGTQGRETDARLDAPQRARLLEIANKCPVHRTLHSEVWIPTTPG